MQKSITAETRKGLLLSSAVLGLIAALVLIPYQFRSEAGVEKDKSKSGLIVRGTSVEEGLEEMYDIREDASAAAKDALADYRQKNGKDAVAVADLRDNFVRGEEALKRKIPNVKVEYNTDIRIPEVITPDVWKNKIQRLTGASQAKRSEILRNFIKENNLLVGLDNAQIDALKVTADYTNPDGNLSFAHLEQFINDVPVFRGEVKAGFTKNGEIIRVINNLAPGLDYESLSTDFGDPVRAVKFAAEHVRYELKEGDLRPNESASDDLKVKFGEGGDWDILAEKMYFPTEPGVAIPAWRVLIWKPINAYYVIVDAHTGTVLWRKNIANDQTQAATYDVYVNPNAYIPVHDSPAPLTPGPTNPALGTQGALLERTQVTRIGNEPPYDFNNKGWVTDGTNVTDGNNVEAGVDRSSPNGVDAPQTGNPDRVFTSTWNPPPGNPAPGDAPLTTQAQRGAVIQMFWVMNWYHDELYRLGFTEQARNFQHDNFGRGGLGNDRVSAEGQDFSSTNNANFATPADGSRGRMQMFLWTGPTPNRDGTPDADVVIHEVTHGLSNRLHGNATGLGNQGGMMGEGWGDFFGHAMLSEPTDALDGIYTTGGYVTYQLGPSFNANFYYGIRRFPKAIMSSTGGPNNKPHNPLTFGHINANCDTTLGTTTTAVSSAFPRNPVIATSGSCSQVHNAGEIWSSALWEVRTLFVSRLGWAEGTRRTLQFVVDGMKLAPINPTFLQERDAIIAAAAAYGSGEASADVADVREGFRIRGMGFSASVQTNTSVTEAFDRANVIMTNPFSVSDSTGDNDGAPEPGENVLITVTVTNTTGETINNVVANINGGPNVSFGNVADGQTVSREIPYTIPSNAPCGSTHSVTINISSDIGEQAPQTRSFRLGKVVGSVSENFDGVTAPALPAGWTTTTGGGGVAWVTSTTRSVSSPNSVFTPNQSTTSEASLVTPDLNIPSTGEQIKFDLFHETENGWDGAVLEISINGGAFQDILAAGGSFDQNGYNGTLGNFSGCSSNPNPLAGREAWTGNSNGFKTVVVGLPMAAYGQTIKLRVRMGSDCSVSANGVAVDNFESMSYSCDFTPQTSSPRGDFDGDGKTDVAVFRSSDTNWYVNRSTDGFVITQFGLASDILTPGDFDGDGKADIAVFRPSQGIWYRLNSSNGQFFAMQFGANGDVPVPGDYDGDGKDDIAVFRPSDNTWYRLNSSDDQFVATPFGVDGDIVTNGDFDGDGKRDLAVFRPSDATWYRLNSSDGQLVSVQFGMAGDITVPADYDGDGKDDIAVFRPSNGTWYTLNSSDGQMSIVQFGASGDVPAPGDYDGDGKYDQAVYRNGTWYMNQTTSGFGVAFFGLAGDKPIPNEYLQ